MTKPIEKDARKIAKGLASRNFKANLKHNKVMMIAIALVTFMMFTIFSVGMSFYTNYQTMNLRMKGTNVNGLLTQLSDEQLLALQQEPDVSSVGQQYAAGMVSLQDGETHMALTAYDNTEWTKHIKQTVDDIKGSLPEQENEIMLSLWDLEQLGIAAPQIGMKIPLSVSSGGATRDETFVLSGWFNDYVGAARPAGSYSGNVMAASITEGGVIGGNAIVSVAYAEAHGAYMLTTFNAKSSDTALTDRLKEKLHLTDYQTVINSRASEDASGTLMALVGAGAGGLLIMLCGYLLIYNIAYISVTKDIQFYGLLKTLGAAKKQIKQVVRRQILLLSLIGIPIGLLLGSAVAIVGVPFILNALLSGGGLGLGVAMTTSASYNPIIYVVAILFTWVTVLISCLKPAKMAGKISPVVAVRFNGVAEKSGGKLKTKGRHGFRLSHMAFRNVFRDKKRAVLVFLSLFMGLTVFLSVYTLFSSPDWSVNARMDAPYDFSLTDITIKDMPSAENAQLNADTLDKISSIEGIQDKEIVYGLVAELQSNDAVWDTYLTDKLKVSAVEEDSLRASFHADAAGVTSELLQTLPLAYGSYGQNDLAGFEQGDTVYLSPTEAGAALENLVDQTIHLTNTETGELQEYTVAGVLAKPTPGNLQEGQNSYSNIGLVSDNNVTVSTLGQHRVAQIYMSKTGMERISNPPVVNRVLLNVAPENMDAAEEALKEIVKGNPNMNLLVQNAYIEANKMALGGIMAAGTIFSVLLLLIGLMNFANTMTTTVYARQRELATMESIGMTKKQINRMLTYEGLDYAFVSMLLLLIVGIPFAWLLIKLVQGNMYYLTFQPPVVAVAVIAVFVMLICVVVPRSTFKRISKESVIERLRVQ